MRPFTRNNKKETIILLKKEVKRLEQERNELYTELEAIKNYKQQYEDLIAEVSALKDKYEKLIKKAESISSEYKEKLQTLIDEK